MFFNEVYKYFVTFLDAIQSPDDHPTLHDAEEE